MAGASRKVGWFLLGLLLAAQAGCAALAIAGAAGAAGAAGYLYYNGLLYRDYPTSLGDSVAAVRAALADLQFPVLKEKNDTGSAYFETETGDGHSVRVHLDTVSGPIRADGILTRVSVRVGFAGDEVVSARILDQISRHLVPPTALPAAPVVGARRGPAQTAAPPVATDRLVPVAATEKR